MIKFIAAIDSKLGLADAHGIPWQGRLPTDVAYFRQKTLGGNVMMGAGWYAEQKQPLPGRRNLVATHSQKPLRPGFELIEDATEFLKNSNVDIWVGGGAALFASTLGLANELYITRLETDFSCTKYFPKFEQDFTLVERSDAITENDITFKFEVWRRSTPKP